MGRKRVLRTRSRITWMGRFSGYDRVCSFIDGGGENWDFVDVHRTDAPEGPIRRRYFHHRSTRYGDSPNYEASSYILERKVLREVSRSKPDLIHLMYLEKDLGLLADRARDIGCPLLATAHQPSSWWKLMHPRPEVTECLAGVVVLNESETSFWEAILPGRVYVAPHGVDVEFFRPSEERQWKDRAPSCLVVGHWLRDFATLTSVVARLADVLPELSVDVVLPHETRSVAQHFALARHQSVTFHAGLTDDELLALYQRSSLLLLPLLDATANNAILEAMACGLPIVTTDLPGLGTYVDPSFADLLTAGDVEAAVDAVVRIVGAEDERVRRGEAARTHAENNLSWHRVAGRLLDVYKSIL